MRPRLAALLCAALLAPACAAGDAGGGGRPQVVTSVFPLTWLAQRIGGEHVDVVDVVPAGAEPHDVELTPAQVAAVERAALVVLIRGLQPALDDAARGAVTFDALAAAGGDDPHVWLDPVAMHAVGARLTEALAEVAPAAADEIRGRWTGVSRELTAVHDAAAAALDTCRGKDLVTSHAAFGRFAARYGLRPTAIVGVDAEAEPSPRRIAEVAAFVREHDVTTVFAESPGSRPARTVARETGARVVVLDPIEVAGGRDYLTVLRDDVRVVAEALGCR